MDPESPQDAGLEPDPLTSQLEAAPSPQPAEPERQGWTYWDMGVVVVFALGAQILVYLGGLLVVLLVQTVRGTNFSYTEIGTSVKFILPVQSVWWVLVCWVVFTPVSATAGHRGWFGEVMNFVVGPASILHPWADALEKAANVVMFVPLGLLMALLLPPGRRWISVPTLAAYSAAIELIQLLIPGRVSTVTDVVMNTLGAAIGWAAIALVTRSRGGRLERD